MKNTDTDTNFDFEKWITWRLSPYVPSGHPPTTISKIVTPEQLIIDLAYDYDRSLQVGTRKATATAKRTIKASILLAKNNKGVYLKGRTPIKEG